MPDCCCRVKQIFFTKPTAISSSQSFLQQSNLNIDFIMDLERKNVAPRNEVAMGSVWESRMRGDDDNKIHQLEKPIEKNQSSDELVEKDKTVLRSKKSAGKRKTWKSDGNNERTPSQIYSKVSLRSDGNAIKKSPLHLKKQSSQVIRPSLTVNTEPSVHTTQLHSNGGGLKTRALSRKSIDSSSTKLVPISKNASNHESQEKKSKDGGEEIEVVCEEKLMTNDSAKAENKNFQENEEEEGCDNATLDGNEMVNEERAIVIVKEMEPISTINKNNKSFDDDVVIEEKKNHQRSNPISRRQPSHPVVNHPNEFPRQRVTKSHNKLQSFIDLIMWRDASKSALIFGVGTFSIISSSYTQHLNISCISGISYLGLIYLAAVFIFRSFLLRGVVEENNNNINIDDEESVVGEEEAIWALKLFLPYINEFLLKVKALFSGDPATTMKLAVLLFILARCGSSITIWKMAKLAFFGVFTVPKICSTYSSQLTAYGTFWVERFKDAWESCSQKKAVAFGIFTLVWNLSSVVARIWAVFMLLVAFKYHQQSMVKNEVVREEEDEEEKEKPVTRRNQKSLQEQRNGNKGLPIKSTKLRKRS